MNYLDRLRNFSGEAYGLYRLNPALEAMCPCHGIMWAYMVAVESFLP